jgi:hypothetical protein
MNGEDNIDYLYAVPSLVEAYKLLMPPHGLCAGTAKTTTSIINTIKLKKQYNSSYLSTIIVNLVIIKASFNINCDLAVISYHLQLY